MMEQNKEKLTLVEVKRREKKRKRRKIILVIVSCIIAVLIAGVIITFMVLRSRGEKSLKEKTQQNMQDDTDHSGYITYKGKEYRYKKDMVNILCMGIDIRQENLDEWAEEDKQVAEEGTGEKKTSRRSGQADAIFIVALDTNESTVDIIAIPRDIMVPVKKYSVDGKYEGMEEMQITLQHAYGDGKEQSCELMEEAVSNLFYQLPINGYCSINMLALPIINDAVGGVPVHIDEDLTVLNPDFTQGSDILLMGDAAMDFVGGRDITEAQSSLARIGRQKQYLLSFVQSAKTATASDITLPVELYQTLSEYMVTDVSIDEATYLASEALQCSFSEDSLHIVEVDVQMGEEYEEYYVKEEELYQMIVDVFYEEVEE